MLLSDPSIARAMEVCEIIIIIEAEKTDDKQYATFISNIHYRESLASSSLPTSCNSPSSSSVCAFTAFIWA